MKKWIQNEAITIQSKNLNSGPSWALNKFLNLNFEKSCLPVTLHDSSFVFTYVLSLNTSHNYFVISFVYNPEI